MEDEFNFEQADFDSYIKKDRELHKSWSTIHVGHDHCALESCYVTYLHVDKQYVLDMHVWSQQKALGFIYLYLEHRVIISERQNSLHKHLWDVCQVDDNWRLEYEEGNELRRG